MGARSPFQGAQGVVPYLPADSGVDKQVVKYLPVDTDWDTTECYMIVSAGESRSREDATSLLNNVRWSYVMSDPAFKEDCGFKRDRTPTRPKKRVFNDEPETNHLFEARIKRTKVLDKPKAQLVSKTASVLKAALDKIKEDEKKIQTPAKVGPPAVFTNMMRSSANITSSVPQSPKPGFHLKSGTHHSGSTPPAKPAKTPFGKFGTSPTVTDSSVLKFGTEPAAPAVNVSESQTAEPKSQDKPRTQVQKSAQSSIVFGSSTSKSFPSATPRKDMAHESALGSAISNPFAKTAQDSVPLEPSTREDSTSSAKPVAAQTPQKLAPAKGRTFGLPSVAGDGLGNKPSGVSGRLLGPLSAPTKVGTMPRTSVKQIMDKNINDTTNASASGEANTDLRQKLMNNTAATQSVGGALPKGFGAQSSAPTTFNPVQKTTPISHSREPAPMGSGMGQFSSGRSQTDTAAGPLFISKPPQTNVPVLAKTDTPATTTEAPSPPGATAATISLPSGKENVLGERNPSVLAKLTRGSLMAPLVLGVRKR